MQITDFKYRRRRAGDEILVTLDDDSILTLDAEVAVQFHLARGMELAPETLEEIHTVNEIVCAKRKLIRYLALRKKSVAEARMYLKRNGFSDHSIDQAIERALEMKYLDDAQYAEAFVRTRMKSGTKGPRVITKELWAKGIDSEEARNAVEPMNDIEHQKELARRVAARKYPSLKDESDIIKSSRKLKQHLSRRGFDPDICEQITREFFGDPTQF